jgi:hypothetical protein
MHFGNNETLTASNEYIGTDFTILNFQKLNLKNNTHTLKAPAVFSPYILCSSRGS